MPRLNAVVTRTSGPRVVFLCLLPDLRMRVRSLVLKVEFETDVLRLSCLNQP